MSVCTQINNHSINFNKTLTLKKASWKYNEPFQSQQQHENLREVPKCVNSCLGAYVHIPVLLTCPIPIALNCSTVFGCSETCSTCSSRYPFLAHGLPEVTKVSVTIFPCYLPTNNLTASLHYTFWSRKWRWVMPLKYQLPTYYMTTDSHSPGHCSLKAWQVILQPNKSIHEDHF